MVQEPYTSGMFLYGVLYLAEGEINVTALLVATMVSENVVVLVFDFVCTRDIKQRTATAIVYMFKSIWKLGHKTANIESTKRVRTTGKNRNEFLALW